MIRKLIILIKSILLGISYTIKSNYSRYIAVRTLKKQVLTLKRNPWVEYISCHTPMNYRDALEVYNFYCIHVVPTPKSTKSFTNFVMDMTSCGYRASDIKLCIYIAYREVKREAQVVVKRKVGYK